MLGKVLIIDDDPDLLAVMTTAFTASGFQTRGASNGKVGTKLFEADPSDLVVTDILMPDKEGISTIIDFKRSPRPPKVIAISGGGRFGDQLCLKWAQQLGADAILPKPFRLSALVTTAARLLGSAAAEPTETRAAGGCG
jgi:DNA-binding response OmpR family regulator